MNAIVVLSACRTPIGSFQGALSSVPTPRLGANAIRGALSRAGMAASTVTDVLMGNVLQAGLGQAPARQAAVHAGLPASTRCVTVHKVCGSGMQAIVDGTRALRVGEADVVVAGGMENMSAAPYLLPKAREGYRLGHQQLVDSIVRDGLWDPYSDVHMGSCAELCAKKFGFSREMQDAYAAESFRRANRAQQTAAFAAEIEPVAVADGRGGERKIDQDEGPAKVNYEKMPLLRPVFEPKGTVTAANASSLNDGAAALVLSTEEHARSLGVNPLARIVAFGAHAQEPAWFTTAPAAAARQALARAGWRVEQVDLWEVNEAFAVVPLAFLQELKVSPANVNVNGGAISLGHPIGASGARILVTLLSALRTRSLQRGVAAICIGGGEALAACVELMDA